MISDFYDLLYFAFEILGQLLRATYTIQQPGILKLLMDHLTKQKLV